MLQSSNNFLEILNKFGISFESNSFYIDSDCSIQLDSVECIELVREIIKNPKTLKSYSFFRSNPNIKFSLASWVVGHTNITSQLVSNIFNSRLTDPSLLEDYSYICNYIKIYEPDIINSIESDIIKFYKNGIDAELRPLFIKLLPNFCNWESSKEWEEIILFNWREGRRDLAQASLQTLLKNNTLLNEIFNSSDQLEKIDNLEILKDLLIASSSEKIFLLFRDRVCTIIEISFHKQSKVKNAKVDHHLDSSSTQWTVIWFSIIETLKTWSLSSDSSIVPIDLLSKLTISALICDKSTFKLFYTYFIDSSDQIKLDFLSNLIPESLEQCTSLFSILPKPLLQLFSQLLKSSETSDEIILALCRLFMDNFLGTSARKLFVNYLAAHVEDKQLGERCLSLIETFVERFPDSRYVCLALIKNLLEGVDTWEPRLLEPFYSSYSLMARSSDSVMNDLILLLKKQIYSSDVVYKRIGARGVGIFLSKNGLADRIKEHERSLLPDPDDTFNDVASCSQQPNQLNNVRIKCDYHLRIIISLLEESVQSLRSDCQSMLLFLKYVNDLFESLDEEIKDWIGDWTRSVFQSTFVTQIDEDSFAYKYDQDQDNPLALDFSNEELKDCSAVLLSILGKYEKYQNGGSLESIDAIQSCVIQIPMGSSCSSLSEEFHLRFIVLNHFRTVLNTFEGENHSRLEISVQIQRELRDIIKSKPSFLSEFRLFPECKALIKPNSSFNSNGDDFSIPEGSFLEALLVEARKPENRNNRLISNSSAEHQLFAVNELNFQKSLVPLNMSLLDKIASSNNDQSLCEFLFSEIDSLIETKTDVEYQRSLLDILIKLMPVISNEGIEIIFKCKKDVISSSQKTSLIKLCKEVFKSHDVASNFKLILIQNVCKLLIDVLKCPEVIIEPINWVKIYLSNQSNSNGILKSLLMLPNLEINSLINEIKNDKIPLKNRMILLKSFSFRYSSDLKFSDINDCQKILSNWAEVIQFIRSSGIQKLLQGIVKESHMVLESFLSSNSLKQIESDALLLEGSSQRESVLHLMKTVQQSTRGLQIICNHLKYSNSRTEKFKDHLAIPNLKKTLESLIFRVKDLLARSGCLGAFWMGNLKHRDLEGQEISSQVELLVIKDESEDEDSEDGQNSEKISEEFIFDSEMEDTEVL